METIMKDLNVKLDRVEKDEDLITIDLKVVKW